MSPADLPPSPRSAPAEPEAAVTAVVVTYHPHASVLRQQLACLVAQVGQVVVVDNTPTEHAAGGPWPQWPQVLWLPLRRNAGLAAAQNLGLQEARRLGAEFVLLLDQDSLPAPGMSAALLQVHAQASAQGLRVGAVGPLVVGLADDSNGFVRFGLGRYQAVLPRADEPWLRCDMLIASGSLIPMAVLDDVGGMAEPLFIDKVDFEWCLRALAKGWLLLGTGRTRLQHQLGERQRRVWFLGWRSLPVHRPFRYYYMVRNSLLVRRMPHASPAWLRADRRQLLSLLLYFGLLLPGRWAALRMMARGCWHGLRGIGGPLPP